MSGGNSAPNLYLRAGAAIFGLALLMYIIAMIVAAFATRPLLFDTNRDPVELPRTIPEIQKVEIETSDGERLASWYLPPQPGKPVVLFFDGRHGGLSSRRFRFQRMRDAGVGALSVAYRGFSGSTGSPSEAGVALDAEAAYAWLSQRQPPSEIVIHGVSLGSAVAVRLAAERPARALVLEAPFTSATAMTGRQAPWLPMRQLTVDRFQSDQRIGAVHMPILIVHGDKDRVIPVSEGRKLYELAPGPKRLIVMHGGDHLTLVRQGLYDHVWHFLGIPFTGSTAFEGRPVPAESWDQPSR